MSFMTRYILVCIELRNADSRHKFLSATKKLHQESLAVARLLLYERGTPAIAVCSHHFPMAYLIGLSVLQFLLRIGAQDNDKGGVRHPSCCISVSRHYLGRLTIPPCYIIHVLGNNAVRIRDTEVYGPTA